MIDAGLSLRYIRSCMLELGVEPKTLAGILISHEHTDHIRNAPRLSKQLGSTIYLSRTTYGLKSEHFSDCLIEHITPLEAFKVGSFDVIPFPLPHDAAETLGFRVRSGEATVALATDIGSLTPVVVEHMRGCRVIVLEANYDYEMLVEGPYPPALKQRILGQMGHFSNADCLHALKELVTKDTQAVVLAHLSEENNDPGLAAKTVSEGLGGSIKVLVAYPKNMSASVEIG